MWPLVAQVVNLRPYAPALAGMVVLAIAAGVAHLTAGQPVTGQGAAHHALPPQNLAGWEQIAPPAGWSRDAQDNTESLNVRYRSGARELRVVVARTLAAGAKLPTVAQQVGEKGLWREKRVQRQRICDAADCITLLHTTWDNRQSDDLRNTYFIYQVGGFTTTSDLALRGAHGWNRLTGRHDTLQSISLVYGATIAPDAELARVFHALRSALAAGNP